MFLAPDSIEEKIGLARIRARLEELTLGAPGVDVVRSLRPDSDRERVRRRLMISEELLDCLRFGDAIPFWTSSDLTEALKASRPVGAALATELLMDIRREAQTARVLRSFFASRSEAYPNAFSRWSMLVAHPELEEAVDGVFEQDGRIRDSASPELKRIRRELHGTRQSLRSLISDIMTRAVTDGIAGEDQPTIRAGRMVIPVVASAKRKLSGFVHDVSASGQTVYVEPRASLDLNNSIRELEIAEVREIEQIRRALTDLVREAADDLRSNMALLAQFDAALAVARLANEIDGSVPELNEDGTIRIRNGRNPELLAVYRAQGRDETVVPLDLDLGDSFNTLVISGPNAGGKSVALKTVGLLVAMLGMGIPVPVAPDSSFCLFGQILVDIGDEQSVEDDLSTYSSHLRNLGSMLSRADADTLILIDEAGTGTDPDEGASLAQAILETLTEAGARTVATTHHGGLKAFAHDAEGVANGSMSFDAETLRPTYVFRVDVPGASYAMEIAEKVGLPKDVIARARSLTGSDRLRLESLVLSLESANEQLEERLSRTATAVEAAERDRQVLEDRLERLQAERDDIRKKAVDEAEEIIRNANRAVERAVREIRESQADSERTREARKQIEKERSRLADRSKRLKRRSSSRTPSRSAGEAESVRSAPGDSTLRVGDVVRLEDAGAEGEILSLKGEEALVRLGDLQSRVAVSRLRKVSGAREQRVTVRQSERSGGSLTAEHLERRIDLRGCRVDEAIARVVALVDEASAAGLDQIEILHGKGTGALRQAVQEYLTGSGQVSRIEEAPWNEGGAGVTIAWLSG